MTTPTLHFPLRSDFVGRTRTGTISASPTGPQRFVNGAYYAEEATTNMLINPSAEVDATTGIAARSSAVITRDTTTAAVGNASLKIVTPGAVNNEGVTILSAASLGLTGASNGYTGQVRLKGAGNVTAFVQASYTDASFGAGTLTNIALTADWTTYTLPNLVLDSAKTVNTLRIVIYTNGTQAITFWADAAQVEQKTYITTYADGSLGTGYAWTGTAHASASTRAESQLTFNPTGLINLTEGEMHVRVAYGNSAVAAQYAFLHLNGTNSRLYLLRLPATDKIGVGLGSSGNGANEPGTTPDGTSIVQGMSWLNNAAISYKNGVQSATTTPASGLTAITTAAYIGGNPANLANGPVSDLMIFDRRLTDSERARLMATPQWSFDVLKKKVYRGLTLPV